MRVAVCSYWYPPARTIASLRIAKFVKFLPEFGWDPHVFTIAPVTSRYTSGGALDDEAAPGHVYRVPDPSIHVWVDRLGAGIRRGPSTRKVAAGNTSTGLKRVAYRLYRDLVCVPDEVWPWLRHYRHIRDIARAASIDVVFSSSPPATAHLLARRLAQDLRKPWVADLRDPWADMHTVDRFAFRHRIDLWMERRTLGDASALTTVSDTMARQFATDYHKSVHVIMNGYDPGDVPASASSEPESSRLALVYTGMLYEKRRTPAMLFQALAALAARGDVDLSRVVIRLYGRNLAIAERELARFTGLRASVEIGGELSYRESLLAQRRATVLILLEWPDPQASGVLTGKIFEYLSSGRPIIATGPRGGEIDQVLRQTGRGRLAATVEELEALLLDAYKRYLTQGPEPTRSDLTALEPFTRRAMAGRLADVFNAVAGNESC